MLGDIIITVLTLAWVLQEAEAWWGQVYKRFIKGNTCERRWRETQRRLEEPSDCDVVLTFVRREWKREWFALWVSEGFDKASGESASQSHKPKKSHVSLVPPPYLITGQQMLLGHVALAPRILEHSSWVRPSAAYPLPAVGRSEPSIFIATKTLLLETAVDTCSGSS